MDKFFKQIKHNLDERPGTPFEEVYWARMEQKLDRYKSTPVPPVPVWQRSALWYDVMVCLLVCSLLAISNRREEKKEIWENSLSTSLSCPGQAEIVSENDLTSSPLMEQLQHHSLWGENALSLISHPEDEDPLFASSGLFRSSEDIPLKRAYKTYGKPDAKPASVAEASIVRVPVLRYNSLPQPDPDVSFGPGLILSSEEQATKRSRVGRFKVNRLELGLAAGGVQLMTDSLEREFSYSAGLELGLHITPSIRIWGQLSALWMNYEAFQEISSLGIPKWKAPEPTFNLSRVEVERTNMYYSGGI
ncbi:MAG: hypothetical protein AAFV07_02965, partial [Bacteroidota bacterium]